MNQLFGLQHRGGRNLDSQVPVTCIAAAKVMNNRGPMGVKSTAKGVNGRIYHSSDYKGLAIINGKKVIK